MSRPRPFCCALLGFAFALLMASSSWAAGQPPRGNAPDTLWWKTALRHAWLEGGVGWMSAPLDVRRQFEAGQGFAAGLEARPRHALRLRVGGDYQILPALGSFLVVEEYAGTFETLYDTTRYDLRRPGCMGSLRAEAAVRVPGGVWLSGGGGRAYFNDGLPESITQYPDGQGLRPRGWDRDGWTWIATAGASIGLDPILHVPVGIGVHWRSARRSDDRLQFWGVRIGTERP